MSTQLRLRREVASFLASFTGALGEALFDTTNNRLLLQDGVTAGGHAVALLSDIPSLGFTAIRQTVIAGPLTSAGLPNFLAATYGTLAVTTQNVSPTSPLAVTAANGVSGTTFAAVNIVGGSTSNISFAGATASTTNYLYLIIASGGAVTAGITTLQPICQWGGTPSVVNGQFTFNIGEMKGYMGNGTTAPQANIVFIGEVVAGTSTITSTIAYAYNGIYDSGLNALPSASSVTSLSHNLGVTPQNTPTIYLKNISADIGYSVGDIVTNPATGTNTGTGVSGSFVNIYMPVSCVIDRNVGGFSIGQVGWYLANKSTGANSNLTGSKWNYGMRFGRGW